MKRVGNRANL